MKALVICSIGMIMASSVFAADTSCNAESSIAEQAVSGTCQAGRCHGQLASVPVAAAGTCSSGISFNATANTAQGTLTGECTNGQFFALGSALIVDFAGKCSDGSAFSGGSRTRTQWATGTCDANGAFNASIRAWKITVSGACGAAVTGLPPLDE